MALDWSIKEVINFKDCYKSSNDKDDETSLKDLPHQIILSTMIVGISDITKENYQQFYNRLHLLESISGAFFYLDGVSKLISLEDVERMIGLTTNASELTRVKFLKRHKINI
jgi:hypothetical protein